VAYSRDYHVVLREIMLIVIRVKYLLESIIMIPLSLL